MQTIGERLEEARKKKGISIREAAEATKIRGDYLQKFESNQFDIGLTEIYTRGFLRTYANFLKLPAERLLNDYAALGRGDVRPRQPSREIYGRMDISVAHADSAERGATPSETPAPEPSPANRGPARPRTGSSLPTGPDPAVVFKYVKWGGIAVGAILVLLLVNSMFSGRRAAKPATPAAPVASTWRGPMLGLVAVRPVEVSVFRATGDQNSASGELIFSGTLPAGEKKSVPRPGAVFIETESPENLMIELNGTQFPMPPGQHRGWLPAPQ